MLVIKVGLLRAEVRLRLFFSGNLMSHDWRVFDVGGARSLVGDGICFLIVS